MKLWQWKYYKFPLKRINIWKLIIPSPFLKQYYVNFWDFPVMKNQICWYLLGKVFYFLSLINAFAKFSYKWSTQYNIFICINTLICLTAYYSVTFLVKLKERYDLSKSMSRIFKYFKIFFIVYKKHPINWAADCLKSLQWLNICMNAVGAV